MDYQDSKLLPFVLLVREMATGKKFEDMIAEDLAKEKKERPELFK